MPDTKYMVNKVRNGPGRYLASRTTEKAKTTDGLHRGGFPEEVITLKSWPHAIIIVLCGVVNVVPTHPKC